MHITQTVAGRKIVESGFVNYTRIAPSSDGGFLGMGLYKNVKFDMRADERLERLVERMRTEVAQRGWKPETNEEQISSLTVRLLNGPQFFGPYSRDPYNDAVEAKTRLRDCESGTMVCKQQAMVASYVLERLGVENDFCIGQSSNLYGIVAGHAFVQTRRGNIVDATSPNFPYGKNLNGGMIRDGKIAFVELAPRQYESYGGGNMPGLRALAYTFSANKPSLLRTQVMENLEPQLILHERLKAAAETLRNNGCNQGKEGKRICAPFDTRDDSSRRPEPPRR